MAKACKPLPSVDELHRLFTVDYSIGQLLWNFRPDNLQWSRKMAGKVAGSIDKRGYIQVQLGRGNLFAVHRIIFKMAHGLEPTMIDHVDRNKSNNQLKNLKATDHSENALNQTLRYDNTSGCRGVYYLRSRDRWIVKSPIINGKSSNQGYFKTKEDAIAHRVSLYGLALCL